MQVHQAAGRPRRTRHYAKQVVSLHAMLQESIVLVETSLKPGIGVTEPWGSMSGPKSIFLAWVGFKLILEMRTSLSGYVSTDCPATSRFCIARAF